MEPNEFNDLVQQVVTQISSHPCGERLPGLSSGMQSLADELERIRVEIDSQPAAHRTGVLLAHPPAPDWMGREILRRCGLTDGSMLELRSLSPIYNSGMLFGQISEPGCLESGRVGVLAIAGLSALADREADRLRAQLHAWWGWRPSAVPQPYHLIVTAEDATAASTVAMELGLRVVRFPRLAERMDDFPHILHALSRWFGGTLSDFGPDSFMLLSSRSWPGDLAELHWILQCLYRNPVGSREAEFSRQEVQEALQKPFIREPHPDMPALWHQVQKSCRACDDLTMTLMEVPFFVPEANESDPFDDPAPRGQFFRLVSWASQRFHEAAGNKLNFLFRARSASSPTDIADAKRLKRLFDQFRNYQQHFFHVGNVGPSDVLQWLQTICGSERVHPWHNEQCVARLLRDILQMIEIVQRLLRAIIADPGRAELIEQWQEDLNLTWSPERLRIFVQDRLKKVGWRVNARKIADRWLADVQKRLRELRTSSEAEREVLLTEWLDPKLQADPDSLPWVRGGDLEDLGVLPARRGSLLQELQQLQLQGNLQWDDVWERAKQETPQEAPPIAFMSNLAGESESVPEELGSNGGGSQPSIKSAAENPTPSTTPENDQA